MPLRCCEARIEKGEKCWFVCSVNSETTDKTSTMEFLVFSKEQFLEIKNQLADLKSELGKISSNLSEVQTFSALSCEGKTILNVEDLKRLFGISSTTVYRNKNLKSFKEGKRRYYHVEDIMEYLRHKKENGNHPDFKTIDKVLASSVSKKYRAK